MREMATQMTWQSEHHHHPEKGKFCQALPAKAKRKWRCGQRKCRGVSLPLAPPLGLSSRSRTAKPAPASHAIDTSPVGAAPSRSLMVPAASRSPMVPAAPWLAVAVRASSCAGGLEGFGSSGASSRRVGADGLAVLASPPASVVAAPRDDA